MSSSSAPQSMVSGSSGPQSTMSSSSGPQSTMSSSSGPQNTMSSSSGPQSTMSSSSGPQSTMSSSLGPQSTISGSSGPASLSTSTPEGHQCEFVDPVPEDYICERCLKVPSCPKVVSCCGVCFCEPCLELITRGNLPCPGCEETAFTSLNQMKYQKKILALNVYCSMKDYGCVWTGSLQELSSHLNAVDTNGCEYSPMDCPKCYQKVPKTMLSSHLVDLCPQRDYRCTHCNLKGPYESISKEHIDICPYFPMECPNQCGVSFEREFLEYHMPTCLLNQSHCEFEQIGCTAVLRLEDLDQHMKNCTQKHLSLLASEMSKMKLEYEEQLDKVRQRLLKQDQEMKVKDEKIKSLEQKLAEEPTKRDQSNHRNSLTYEFAVPIFSKEANGSVKYAKYFESQPIYTHPEGYKFIVGVYPAGLASDKGSHMTVLLSLVKGGYDDQIKWPAKFRVTLELVNRRSDKGHCTRDVSCDVAKQDRRSAKGIFFLYMFMSHSELEVCDPDLCYVEDNLALLRITRIVVMV